MPHPSVLRPYEPKKRYIPKNIKHEESLQREACGYLRMLPGNIVFRSDFASGMHLTPSQAIRHSRLQSGRAWPDLFIYEPREVTQKDGTTKFYYGMAIELKREGTTIIVSRGSRKGHITSDPHIQEQFLMLKELAKKGYYTNFAVGFDEFRKIVDWYFGQQTVNGTLF